MFTGSYVALLTPFTGEGAIDFAALEKIIAWHVHEGTHGLVPCGTTGESATLTDAEHRAVVEFCVRQAKDRIPVLAGTGSNNTAEAIAFTRHAEECGAQGALLITPYYNKPTQEGLYQHFKAIHDASDIPIVLYDVPGRTVTSIHDATVQRLAELPRIIGLKDATADLARPARLRAMLGEEFCLLSGEDATALAFLLGGGDGCISVTANVAPGWSAAMHNAWVEDDILLARQYQQKLLPLSDLLFTETSPSPVKELAGQMGLCRPDVRLPLVRPSQPLRSALAQYVEKLTPPD